MLGIPYGAPYGRDDVPNDQANAPVAVRRESRQFCDGLEHWDFEHLIVKTAAGTTVLDQKLSRYQERPIQQWLGLEPGRYIVSMEADGRKGTGTLVVEADFSGPESLEITLDQ